MADCIDIEEHNILDDPKVKKFLAVETEEETKCDLQGHTMPEESRRAAKPQTPPIPEQSGIPQTLQTEAQESQNEQQPSEKQTLLVEPDSTTGHLSSIVMGNVDDTLVSTNKAVAVPHKSSKSDGECTVVAKNTASDNKQPSVICLEDTDEDHIGIDEKAGAKRSVPDSTIALGADKCNDKGDAVKTVTLKLRSNKGSDILENERGIAANKLQRDKKSCIACGDDSCNGKSSVDKTRVKKNSADSKSMMIRGARVNLSQIESLGKVTSEELDKILNAKVFLTDIGASLVYTDMYCVECGRLFCLRKDLFSHMRSVHGDLDFDKRHASECRKREEERLSMSIKVSKKTQSAISGDSLSLQKKRLKKRKMVENAITEDSDETGTDSDGNKRKRAHLNIANKSVEREANKNSTDFKNTYTQNDTNPSTQIGTARKKSAAGKSIPIVVLSDVLPSISDKEKYDIPNISNSQEIKKPSKLKNTLCFHCNVNFETKEDLIAHMYDILMKNSHKCQHCSKTFDTEKALGQHSVACPKERRNSNGTKQIGKLITKKKIQMNCNTPGKNLQLHSETSGEEQTSVACPKERRNSNGTKQIDKFVTKKKMQMNCNTPGKSLQPHSETSSGEQTSVVCPKERRNSNGTKQIDKLITKKKIQMNWNTPGKNLQLHSETSGEEQNVNNANNKIDVLYIKKRKTCSTAQTSIKNRKVNNVKTKSDALLTKKKLQSKYSKIVKALEKQPKTRFKVKNVKKVLDKMDGLSKIRQNKFHPSNEGDSKLKNLLNMSVPVQKEANNESTHALQTNKDGQIENEADHVQNSENVTESSIAKSMPRESIGIRESSSENVTESSIAKAMPHESIVKKESSAVLAVKTETVDGNTADIELKYTPELISAVNSNRETVIHKTTVQSEATDGSNLKNKTGQSLPNVKIHKVKDIIDAKVESLFSTNLVHVDKKKSISEYVKSKIKTLYAAENDQSPSTSKTTKKRNASKATKAKTPLERLRSLLDNLDISSAEPVSDQHSLETSETRETNIAVGTVSNDSAPSKKPGMPKLIHDICADWREKGASSNEAEKPTHLTNVAEIKTVTSDGPTSSKLKCQLQAQTPETVVIRVKDEVTINEDLSSDSGVSVQKNTANKELPSQMNKPSGNSKYDLATKISRLIDSLPTDIGINGAVSISEIMDAPSDNLVAANKGDLNPKVPPMALEARPAYDPKINQPLPPPQPHLTSTVAKRILRVPNSVLFRCRKCPLHFVKANSAYTHLSRCLHDASIHPYECSPKLPYEKCIKCGRFVWPLEMQMHQQQHRFSREFRVTTLMGGRTLDRLLFYCHKCGVHYSEHRFYEHDCSVRQDNSIYCKYCDAILDGTMVQHLSMHAFGTFGPENFITVFFDDFNGTFWKDYVRYAADT